MMTPEALRRLPKAELHVHLDGSLRPATMLELGQAAGVRMPADDPARLRSHMRVDDARNLEDYLARFDLTIALLQTPEAIERVAYEMCEDAARDGIWYLEVRYCPMLSCQRGLTLDDVITAEWQGLQRGERDFGITARIICCSLRHYDPVLSLEIARHAVSARHLGVVGFDLAGGEAGRLPGRHAAAFDAAAEGGLGITVHAGEAAGAESISEAIFRCHANRIGHGTRLWENPVLQDYVRDRRICVEANITSNIQTRAVPDAASHPVRRYVREGLNVTLGTDNWLMSDVSLSGEYQLAQTALNFSREEITRMLLNGFESAFLPWPERRQLIERAESALGTA
jgi:adenosine deaminase